MLSGLNSAKDKALCLNAGADDFIEKPVYKEELLARINAVNRRANYIYKPIIKIGQLNIDLPRRVVYSDCGEILDLTEKEYHLIELMARKRGSIISKAHFITHLYDSSHRPEDKIIDVFVCKVRCKIAKLVNDGHEYIRTRWGRGYVLGYQEYQPAKEEKRLVG